jgi:hypothetical protein
MSSGVTDYRTTQTVPSWHASEEHESRSTMPGDEKRDEVADASFEMIEKVMPAVAALVGLRQGFIDGGFRPEVADNLVLVLFQMAAQSQQQGQSQVMSLIQKFIQDRGSK